MKTQSFNATRQRSITDGEWARILRQRAGLPMNRATAQKLGMSVPVITAAEKGRRDARPLLEALKTACFIGPK